MKRAVLVTWLATKGDPFDRVRSGGPYRDGSIPGPTLTLLTDAESPYVGTVDDIVILRQAGGMHEQVYEELVDVLRERLPTVRLHPKIWTHEDPTDHAAIHEWLRRLMPSIRRKFPERELLIHLSPGTPAMHTVWVLMAETGYIEKPYTAVQSLRPHDRRGRAAVVPLNMGLDTFFKRWRETRPASAKAQSSVRWDPRQFRSTRLKELYTEARRVAQLRVPVLILGERGTGKTTLASWIRFRSPFRNPKLDVGWPAVPCGQYTSETMRAELFGYVKGAFTGANETRPGLLARANGDTLFLDEIGDISPDLQRLLIKVLEEREYLPLGGTEPQKTTLRLLTATNLTDERLRERLAPDFLDRISAFRLIVPPLRELPEELDWLWPTTLVEAARRADVPEKYARLSAPQHQRIVAALKGHPLSGNVRDLFRVAWRFLAARNDDESPATVEGAVDYALEALSDVPGARDPLVTAFDRGRSIPIDALAAGPLNPNRTIGTFKRWFAGEVADLAKRTGRPQDNLTTVTARTLRNWRKEVAD